GRGDGEYGVRVLGLLQHLPLGERDQGSGAKYSAGNISFGVRNHGAVSSDAEQHSGSDSVEGGAGVEVSGKPFCGAAVRAYGSAIRYGDDPVGGAGFRVFSAVGRVASAVFGGD